MGSSNFSVGDLVWAKMKGFPPWPAKITEPPENLTSLAKTKKGHHCCFFFVTENYSWIRDDFIFKHSHSMVPKNMKGKSKQFREAVDMILQQSNEFEVTDEDEPSESDDAKIKPSTSSSSPKRNLQKGRSKQQDSDVCSKSPEKQDSGNKKSPIVGKSRASRRGNGRRRRNRSIRKSANLNINDENSDESSSSSSVNKTASSPIPSSSLIEESGSVDVNSKSEASHSSRINDFSDLNQPTSSHIQNHGLFNASNRAAGNNIGQYSVEPIMNFFPSTEETTSSPLSIDFEFPPIPGFHPDVVPRCPRVPPEYVERPPTPEFKVSSCIEDLPMRHVRATQKKIGFLGLGFIGKIIVKRLLHSGHYVTIWNRTPSKCDIFNDTGVHKAQTPADVVTISDVTFCCLSDTEAVRAIVFENCGVLNGMDSRRKGFCVLNTIAPDASIDINKAIAAKGGLYLEAFLQGTRSMAASGSLLIIAGGNHAVFSDCYSCFRSFARHAYFVSFEIGPAAVLNVLLQSVNAQICHALADAIAFVEKNNASVDEFLSLLKNSRIYSDELYKSAVAIRNKDFTTEISVKLYQQALEMVTNLSGDMNVPTPITAFVLEQYKYASHLRYFDHDGTAVYQSMK